MTKAETLSEKTLSKCIVPDYETFRQDHSIPSTTQFGRKWTAIKNSIGWIGASASAFIYRVFQFLRTGTYLKNEQIRTLQAKKQPNNSSSSSKSTAAIPKEPLLTGQNTPIKILESTVGPLNTPAEVLSGKNQNNPLVSPDQPTPLPDHSRMTDLTPLFPCTCKSYKDPLPLETMTPLPHVLSAVPPPGAAPPDNSHKIPLKSAPKTKKRWNEKIRNAFKKIDWRGRKPVDQKIDHTAPKSEIKKRQQAGENIPECKKTEARNSKSPDVVRKLDFSGVSE